MQKLWVRGYGLVDSMPVAGTPAGWKGRGLYADYGPNAVWHMEGGLGSKSALVKFQMRPTPLAK